MLRRPLLLLVFLIVPIWANGQTENDFFNTDKLQEIRIEIRPQDWALLKKNYLDNTYYACEFHWIFNGKDIETPEVAIRSRGQGSRSGVKPSLKVEFDRYESTQTFLGLKNIVLRANTQDASMMHERVAMELFRKMGLAVSRETHTKLYINGEYSGLYTIVESIDKPFLRSHFNEDTGYLYNYQYHDPFFFEDRGPNPATYSPVPFEPEFSSQVPNPGPLAAMVQAINQTSDANFISTVGQFVDINEFLTEIAAENYLAEQDGLIGDYGLNNFYFYRFAGKNLHTFIPWDKSNTFFALDWPITHNLQANRLSRRATAFPELLAVYRDSLARAAEIAGGQGGWLEQEITKEYLQIQQAAYADPVKLCDPGATGALRPCSNAEFDAAFAFMINFARYRAVDVQSQLSGGVSQQTFSVTNLGGFSSTASNAQSGLKVGYTRILPDAGNGTPSGLAIFTLRNGSTVITEAGVPASSLVRSGRIYAEVNGVVNTGLAIANPNNQPAEVSFYFTDEAGRDFGTGNITIPANGQVAKFLDAAPYSSGTLTAGTFTFNSSVPVGAIALRGLSNERSDYLLTTLPVAPTTSQSGNLTFPHFADGGGWTTQVILVNPGDQVVTGSLQFFSKGSSGLPGQNISVTSDRGTAATFTYSIPAHGVYRLRTAGTPAEVQVGSVRVTPAANSGSPSGVSVFSFRNNGVTVTEAGVPTSRTSSAFRLYAESTGDFAHSQVGSIGTGVAVANSDSVPVVVNFELTDLDGVSTGLTGVITVPANGQNALFLYQVPGLASMSNAFQGVVRISGPASISVVGLRGRYNERGDFLITTTPPVAEDEPPPATELVFPHIAEGAGYTTQFILFSGRPGQTSSGTLRYFGPFGEPLMLGIR